MSLSCWAHPQDPNIELAKTNESIEKLAISVVEGFEQVDKRFEQVDKRFDRLEDEVRALREEVKSIRAELERIPDDIDATYSGTINDLLDRVAVIEKHLGIPAKQ